MPGVTPRLAGAYPFHLASPVPHPRSTAKLADLATIVWAARRSTLIKVAATVAVDKPWQPTMPSAVAYARVCIRV